MSRVASNASLRDPGSKSNLKAGASPQIGTPAVSRVRRGSIPPSTSAGGSRSSLGVSTNGDDDTRSDNDALNGGECELINWWFDYQLFDRLIVWLIDWSIDRLFDWLIDWLIVWLYLLCTTVCVVFVCFVWLIVWLKYHSYCQLMERQMGRKCEHCRRSCEPTRPPSPWNGCCSWYRMRSISELLTALVVSSLTSCLICEFIERSEASDLDHYNSDNPLTRAARLFYCFFPQLGIIL